MVFIALPVLFLQCAFLTWQFFDVAVMLYVSCTHDDQWWIDIVNEICLNELDLYQFSSSNWCINDILLAGRSRYMLGFFGTYSVLCSITQRN